MPTSDCALFITRKGMGQADSELQIKLIQTYFKLIDETDILPAVICFYTEGVHLVVDGSPVLEPALAGSQRCPVDHMQHLPEFLRAF